MSDRLLYKCTCTKVAVCARRRNNCTRHCKILRTRRGEPPISDPPGEEAAEASLGCGDENEKVMTAQQLYSQ